MLILNPRQVTFADQTWPDVTLIALDRKTRAEAWRLETNRYPYPSAVLEASEGRALIQIGSRVPNSLHIALTGGGGNRLQMRMFTRRGHFRSSSHRHLMRTPGTMISTASKVSRHLRSS